MAKVNLPPAELFNPSDDLHFDEAHHRYTGLYGDELRPLVSVTQAIKRFTVPFDAVEHSTRMGERDGVDPQVLRDKWEVNATEAATRGTFIHETIERICHGMSRKYISIPMHGNIPYPSLVQGAAKFFVNHIELMQGWVWPEFRVWHPRHELAGTIDMLASSFRGVPALIDWKTNKSLEVEGYHNMLPPFQRGKLALPDTNLYHYFLQLNLYRRVLMDCYNFEPECMVIIHIEEGRYTEYDVPVMDGHVDKLLEVLASDP